MNKIVVGIVIIILIIAGVYLVMSSNSDTAQTTDISADATEQTATSTATSTDTTATSTATSTSYTMDDVAKHNTPTDCWVAIRGGVYNLTTWINQHPGGKQAILSLCGKDGTTAFTGQHGGQEQPEQTLASFKVGVVAQ